MERDIREIKNGATCNYMTVIISDESKERWGSALEKELLQSGTQVVHFIANAINVEPCTSCGSCGGKTFGRCVIQDDMQTVLPKIVTCRALVLVSPAVFGGVSRHIKKVMDRMMPIADPRYRVSDGEMIKGMRNQKILYHMIGFGDKLSEAERTAFISLHKENCIIMNVKGRAFILDSNSKTDAIKKIANEVSYE